MPAPHFRSAEINFLCSKLNEWQHMKDIPVTKGNLDNILRQHRKFVRQTTADFLSTFPDRDPSISDPCGVTYSQEDLEGLPERLCQWFCNNSRTPVDPEVKKKHNSKSKMHARNLAAKQYSQQIKEIARKLRETDPALKAITAFNRATTQFMSNLKADDPEAHNKLHQDAKDLRGASSHDWTELPPDVLINRLENFPKKVLLDIELYGWELPVHMWCILAFAKPPNYSLDAYMVLTPSLDHMINSAFDKASREGFLSWIQSHLGSSATRQVETAAPMVYPALRRGARPFLPRVDNISKISINQLRTWIQTYFNYHYMWQGGAQSVPWKKISRDNDFTYIPQQCLPSIVKGLISPNDMSCEQLEAWYQWIIDGQEGCLRPEQIFRFVLVDHTGGKRLEYPNPINACPAACNLSWSPEEKLYAARVQKMAKDDQLKPNWNSLPLARLQFIYHPFAGKIWVMMSDGCLPDYRTRDIVNLAFKMEEFGPIHTKDSNCSKNFNAYIHPSMTEEKLMTLLIGPALQPAALLEDMDQHSELALSTFINYAQTSHWFCHAPSETWRGGPFGVRWIVVVYVHFALAFSVYEKLPKGLPTDTVEAFNKCNFSRLKGALSTFGNWFIQTLQATIDVLEQSFGKRAAAWKEAVVAAHLNDPDATIGNDSVVLNTHGVPRDQSTIRMCYEELQVENPDITLGNNSIPLQRLQCRVHKKAERLREFDEDELGDYNSTSGEEIKLPSESDKELDHNSDHMSDVAASILDWEAGISRSPFVDKDLPITPGKDLLEAPSQTNMLSGLTVEQPIVKLSLVLEPSRGPDIKPKDVVDDEHDNELPSQVLAGMSSVKIGTPGIPRTPRTPGTPGKQSRMIMEVVIRTPRKKERQSGESNMKTPSKSPLKLSGTRAEASDKPPEDSTGNLTIAQRRKRRTSVRNSKVEEAIQQATKGKYAR